MSQREGAPGMTRVPLKELLEGGPGGLVPHHHALAVAKVIDHLVAPGTLLQAFRGKALGLFESIGHEIIGQGSLDRPFPLPWPHAKRLAAAEAGSFGPAPLFLQLSGSPPSRICPATLPRAAGEEQKDGKEGQKVMHSRK